MTPYGNSKNVKTSDVFNLYKKPRIQKASRLGYMDFVNDDSIKNILSKMAKPQSRNPKEIDADLHVQQVLPQNLPDDDKTPPYKHIVAVDGSIYNTRDGCFVKCVLLEIDVEAATSSAGTQKAHFTIKDTHIARSFIPFTPFEGQGLDTTLREVVNECLKNELPTCKMLDIDAAGVFSGEQMCVKIGNEGDNLRWWTEPHLGTEYMNLQETLLLFGHATKSNKLNDTLYIHDGPLSLPFYFNTHTVLDKISSFIKERKMSIIGQEKTGRVAEHVFGMSMYDNEYCILTPAYMRRHVLIKPTSSKNTKYGDTHLYGTHIAVGSKRQGFSKTVTGSDGTMALMLPTIETVLIDNNKKKKPLKEIKILDDRPLAMIPFIRGSRYDASLLPIEWCHDATSIPFNSHILEDMVYGR